MDVTIERQTEISPREAYQHAKVEHYLRTLPKELRRTRTPTTARPSMKWVPGSSALWEFR